VRAGAARGVLPLIAADIVRMTLVATFPALALVPVRWLNKTIGHPASYRIWPENARAIISVVVPSFDQTGWRPCRDDVL
jgi:hypothetical protein